jgi:hypothetical protein
LPGFSLLFGGTFLLKRIIAIHLLLLAASISAFAVPTQEPTAQQKEAMRIATRDRLIKLLEAVGPKKGVNISFKQSEKQPFNLVGILRDGLTNSDYVEVVIGVTNDQTIGFRIYPHYNGSYVNIDKARNSAGLMRFLLNLSDKNFLFWGADSTNDVFAGYTFTLESGFPDKALEVVLYSIAPLDKYVGQMRPFIDGTSAPAE